jgi:TonB family protein
LIVPPEKLFSPPIENFLTERNNFVKIPQEKGLRNIPRPSAEIKGFAGQTRGQQGVEAESEVGIHGKLQEIGLPSNLSSNFGLVLPKKAELNLRRYSGKKETSYAEKYLAKPRKAINLSQYLYSEVSNLRSKRRGASSGKYGTSYPFQAGSASFNIKNFDLTPWAGEVLNRIQKNWTIPASEKEIVKSQVGISVMIEKNGELSSAEIVLSSKFESLDQAALEALNLSAPLPKLPDDFPAKSLEAYFLFEYGD